MPTPTAPTANPTTYRLLSCTIRGDTHERGDWVDTGHRVTLQNYRQFIPCESLEHIFFSAEDISFYVFSGHTHIN